ncbi:hypothetical protein MASR1M49_14700 [Pararhodobacter aggregans]
MQGVQAAVLLGKRRQRQQGEDQGKVAHGFGYGRGEGTVQGEGGGIGAGRGAAGRRLPPTHPACAPPREALVPVAGKGVFGAE